MTWWQGVLAAVVGIAALLWFVAWLVDEAIPGCIRDYRQWRYRMRNRNLPVCPECFYWGKPLENTDSKTRAEYPFRCPECDHLGTPAGLKMFAKPGKDAQPIDEKLTERIPFP